MFIKRINIKNFRSIQQQSIDFTSLNVLVGNNDIGKSNFLKALNLFFNNETEVGTPFNFKNDYCAFAVATKKKAPEIVVEIVFAPPKSFKERRDVIGGNPGAEKALLTTKRGTPTGSCSKARKRSVFGLIK